MELELGNTHFLEQKEDVKLKGMIAGDTLPQNVKEPESIDICDVIKQSCQQMQIMVVQELCLLHHFVNRVIDVCGYDNIYQVVSSQEDYTIMCKEHSERNVIFYHQSLEIDNSYLLYISCESLCLSRGVNSSNRGIIVCRGFAWGVHRSKGDFLRYMIQDMDRQCSCISVDTVYTQGTPYYPVIIQSEIESTLQEITLSLFSMQIMQYSATMKVMPSFFNRAQEMLTGMIMIPFKQRQKIYCVSGLDVLYQHDIFLQTDSLLHRQKTVLGTCTPYSGLVWSKPSVKGQFVLHFRNTIVNKDVYTHNSNMYVHLGSTGEYTQNSTVSNPAVFISEDTLYSNLKLDIATSLVYTLIDDVTYRIHTHATTYPTIKQVSFDISTLQDSVQLPECVFSECGFFPSILLGWKYHLEVQHVQRRYGLYGVSVDTQHPICQYEKQGGMMVYGDTVIKCASVLHGMLHVSSLSAGKITKYKEDQVKDAVLILEYDKWYSFPLGSKRKASFVEKIYGLFSIYSVYCMSDETSNLWNMIISFSTSYIKKIPPLVPSSKDLLHTNKHITNTTILGYTYINITHQDIALLHPSKQHQYQVDNNIYEVLGDALWEYGLVHAGYSDTCSVKYLHTLKVHLSNRDIQSQIGLLQHIPQFLQHSSKINREKYLADTMEALLGSIYIDSGYHLATTQKVLYTWFALLYSNKAEH